MRPSRFRRNYSNDDTVSRDERCSRIVVRCRCDLDIRPRPVYILFSRLKGQRWLPHPTRAVVITLLLLFVLFFPRSKDTRICRPSYVCASRRECNSYRRAQHDHARDCVFGTVFRIFTWYTIHNSRLERPWCIFTVLDFATKQIVLLLLLLLLPSSFYISSRDFVSEPNVYAEKSSTFWAIRLL